jgi:hypothetical protein
VRSARNDFALWTGVKVVAAAVVVFVLLRIVVPDLVNAHNTPRLVLAIACGVLALAVVTWTVLSVRRSYRRLKAAATSLIETRP